MRQKPRDALQYYWGNFERWADEEGVGSAFEDWSPWWECWKTALQSCLEL